MWTRVYGLDIETDTSPETAEELAAGYQPNSRGLDPRIGGVINVAIVHEAGTEVFRGDEAEILCGVFTWFHQAAPGVIGTWNGSVFDFPFLRDRAIATGVPCSLLRMAANADLKPKYAPLPGHQGGYDVAFETVHGVPHAHFDAAYAFKDKAAELGVAWSLKPVMKALGVPMVEVDRTKIHLLTAEEQDAYVSSDASAARIATIRALTGSI